MTKQKQTKKLFKLDAHISISFTMSIEQQGGLLLVHVYKQAQLIQNAAGAARPPSSAKTQTDEGTKT